MRYNKALNQYARQDVPRDFDYIYTILSMISGQIKTKNTVNHSLLQSLPVKNFSSNQFWHGMQPRCWLDLVYLDNKLATRQFSVSEFQTWVPNQEHHQRQFTAMVTCKEFASSQRGAQQRKPLTWTSSDKQATTWHRFFFLEYAGELRIIVLRRK